MVSWSCPRTARGRKRREAQAILPVARGSEYDVPRQRPWVLGLFSHSAYRHLCFLIRAARQTRMGATGAVAHVPASHGFACTPYPPGYPYSSMTGAIGYVRRWQEGVSVRLGGEQKSSVFGAGSGVGSARPTIAPGQTPRHTLEKPHPQHGCGARKA